MRWRDLFLPRLPSRSPRPGLEHFHIERPDRMTRVHLRVEEDGGGLMLVDASVAVRLNRTGMALARTILEGKSLEEAQRELQRTFRNAPAEQVAEDYEKVRRVLFPAEAAEDACPWLDLASQDDEPFSMKVSAPYRADLALTYRCQNECPHCYVERERDMPSLSLEQWRAVLERLWDAGIPHVCFTGGEATLCEFLIELVEKAEDLGQVTGLLTNGRRLCDRDYVRRLVGAGLDHVQITIESHLEDVHNRMVGAPGFAETLAGIRNAIAEDIYVVTNSTLTKWNAPAIEQTAEFLHGLGVRAFACNSLIISGGAKESDAGLEIDDLVRILPLIVEKARALGMRFIWYTPTPYCRMNPAQLGLGFKRCTAAEYNICIEPNGDVLPCQSYYQAAGNILTDEWKAIWESSVFRDIRERRNVPDDCRGCPDFPVCGSGCPLSREHDMVQCMDRVSEG
ncbi:MAG: radical SAM protein [Candidatus Brocadiaceae bacterium]|nr:radical SAM protein [Candidatus Brocadiaceae bacterium]